MKIIIEGAGEVGSHLAKMLRAEGNDIVVIDNDAARLAQIELSADVQTIEGNPSSIAVLRSAGVAHADLVIAVYPSAAQEINIVGALLAKQLGAAKVVARICDEDYLTAENKLLFKELGLELMFYPEKIAADEIVDLLRHGTSSETMDFAHGRLQIAVFKIEENTPLLDLKLSEFTQSLSAEEAAQFRIIAISRSDKTIIPGPDTLFRYNDLVFTIAKREGAEILVRLFGKKSLSVDRALIVGGSAVAEMVARGLNRHGIEVKLIEANRERCLELSDHLPDGVLVVNGDGRNSDFLYEEGIRDCDAFIALTENDESNVLSCVVAKKFGVPFTVAEVENIEYIRLAEEMGVDSVINKKLITAGRIFKFTLSGKARFVKYMNGTDAEIIEYTVAPGSAITKGPIKELGFPRGAIIGGVVRGSDSFIAVGDSVIEAYDRVAVFALPETIREIDRFFK